MSRCTFTDHGVRSGLTRKRMLGAFVCELIAFYTKKQAVINYVFVSDEALLDMNRQYLDHDTYTDIITFDLSAQDKELVIGDIYISIDRVKENAVTLGLPYASERLRVILHGALHLSGFGDKAKKQKEEMRALEEKWMKKYRAMDV